MPTATVSGSGSTENFVAVYTQYFAGTGVTEETNNGGNDDPPFPPVTTALAVSNSCDAVQQCAAFAAESNNMYESFDVHYLISEKEYECVAYYDASSSPSDFNVQNADVGPVYGYSLDSLVRD